LEPKLRYTLQERSRLRGRADLAHEDFTRVQRAVLVQMSHLERLRELLKQKAGRKNIAMAVDIENLVRKSK
jgi:hypothetical protein